MIAVIDEFGPGSTSCSGSATGCAVCSTGEILVAYDKPIPRLSDGTPDMVTLGKSMGARCRAYDNCSHGICPVAWCQKCAQLELEAAGVAVGFGKLTHDQIRAHLEQGHWLHVPGHYGAVPVVAPATSSDQVLLGRSDSGFTGGHSVAAAGCDDNGVIIFDPDSGGSSARPVVPRHSYWTWSVFFAFYDYYGWGITYCTQAPAAPVTSPSTGTQLQTQWGAYLGWRGRYRYAVAGRLRKSPFIQADNVVATEAAGTTLRCGQATDKGTAVSGNSRWFGTRSGDRWVHSSLVTFVGPSDGTEAIH